MKKLISYFKKEDGIVAIEYGLIAAGIAIAIVVVVGLVGDELVDIFCRIINALTAA